MIRIQTQSEQFGTTGHVHTVEAERDLPDPSEFSSLLRGPRVQSNHHS